AGGGGRDGGPAVRPGAGDPAAAAGGRRRHQLRGRARRPPGGVRPRAAAGRDDRVTTIASSIESAMAVFPAAGLAQVEDLRAALPEPAARSARQRAAAATALDTARDLRSGFLDRHGAEVYDVLTDGRAAAPRIEDLVERAAAEFPGLVPTAAQ